MKFGEIYICRFPFTSGTASKARPALVHFDLRPDVLICRITSAASSKPRDVAISDWTSAGLVKPSIARLDRLVTAEKSLLHTRLGELTAADKDAIQKAWNRYMAL